MLLLKIIKTCAVRKEVLPPFHPPVQCSAMAHDHDEDAIKRYRHRYGGDLISSGVMDVSMIFVSGIIDNLTLNSFVQNTS